MLLLTFSASLATPAAVLAQGGYFGRNKVQYQEFDFKVLKTEHFDIYFYPAEEEGARMAARMAERWYARLSKILNHQLRGRQPLVLYASPAHFWQTNTIQGELGEGTGGVTEAFKRRIVLPLAGPIQATDHVLGHELVHAFQYDITNTNVSSGTAGALALPLWFIEGMAEYLSIGPVDPHTAMWMREAARREQLPEIDDLENPRYFPYRYGHALWAYVGGRFGDEVIGDMLRAGGASRGYETAFSAILNVGTKELSKDWHNALFEAYRPIAEVTQMPADFGRTIIKKKRPGELNVSPEMSPDGTKVMFFSERDLFSIDLYVADAKTGEIIRKITDTATDAHTESLQFLTSAGAWDRTSTQFVFPGISRGQPVLTIVDVNQGKKLREIRVPEVHEIVNPTWSPDGKQIAFSGLLGGFNDLFVYDLDAGAVRRLTTDSFAELDPAWSPDGKRLAFSTDRFTTNLQTLEHGDLRLAVMDVASGDVRTAGGFENAKNIGPQWTADGNALFFLSDRGGITNVYRTEFGGATTQLTNLLTGVSGITELSPALSVVDGHVAFSAYEDDGYTVYALETPEQLAGTGLIQLPQNAAVLPPRRKGEGPVYALIENEALGLPPATAEPVPAEEYKPKLGLDFAGQPSIGVGRDPFGTYATGGVSFVFSDMLGNHTLGVGAQVTNRFDEFGGSLFYMNRKHRWNWGAAIEQIPYVARGFDAGVTVIDGIPVYAENEYRILQIDRSFSGLLSYPLSRAQRVDFSGGFRQIGFKQDLTQRLYDYNTGQQLTEDRTDLGSEPLLHLGEARAALVYDTAISGITSPIRGNRYRVEVGQTAGSLQYTGVLTDFRTYQMPFQPFTFAVRGLYYGRFGNDAESLRLPTLYLGYPGLVRGYDSGSFEALECGITADGSCPTFDRLFGSRIALVNAEVRFPLWSALGGSNFYGPLPIEMAVFADSGVAWGQGGSALFGGTNKEPVTSVGVAMRVNLFGFAVGEIDYVKPIDRPDKGWMWQFNLMPGF